MVKEGSIGQEVGVERCVLRRRPVEDVPGMLGENVDSPIDG